MYNIKNRLQMFSTYKTAECTGRNVSDKISDVSFFVRECKEFYLSRMKKEESNARTGLVSFAENKFGFDDITWMQENHQKFIKSTPNKSLAESRYLSQVGFVCCMDYSKDGEEIIVGHSTGFIQMRHGKTGTVLATLRNIQFPPKPVYALAYSRHEERVCYATCTDGNVYRIEIPNITPSLENPPSYCIRADPALECLSTQFYGTPGVANYATPFFTQRTAALSLGLTVENAKMVVGYEDASIKVFDIETQEVVTTYKVHKMRLQYIPKKMQRLHVGQVCAVRCHHERPSVFASAAWDNTLRIWDLRCHSGCVMTFEGVNVCGDSIDLNRDQCISGSWQPTEALTVWDLAAKKQLSIIRVQNRRPNVDGEYIYACRYWRSSDYNRKGKYAITGGSGTQCVEVINLHNRYISCSYPAEGTITAITSYQERIAFGGTMPVINIVSFHDPKHEKYDEAEKEFEDISRESVTYHDDEEDNHSATCSIKNSDIDIHAGFSNDAL